MIRKVRKRKERKDGRRGDCDKRGSGERELSNRYGVQGPSEGEEGSGSSFICSG